MCRARSSRPAWPRPMQACSAPGCGARTREEPAGAMKRLLVRGSWLLQRAIGAGVLAIQIGRRQVAQLGGGTSEARPEAQSPKAALGVPIRGFGRPVCGAGKSTHIEHSCRSLDEHAAVVICGISNFHTERQPWGLKRKLDSLKRWSALPLGKPACSVGTANSDALISSRPLTR